MDIKLIIIENIIINIAKKKYNEKIKCDEQKFHNTIIVSLDEIKEFIINSNCIYNNFNDIENIFYEYNYNDYKCNMCGFYIYKSNNKIPILQKLKKRIKYEFFSRYYKKAKKVYMTQSDSGVLLIVFQLK